MEDLVYRAAYGRRREILLLLYSEGAVSLNKLRSRLGVSSSALLFDVSALEALGLVKRDGNMLELTDQGVKVASVLSSLAPLRSLSALEALGLRPFVVPILVTPHLEIVAFLLLAIWGISLYISRATLVGVIYTFIFNNIFLSIPISVISLSLIMLLMHFISRRRLHPVHIIIGLFPLLTYPSISLIINNYYFNYTIKFILLLLTCGTLATVTSYDGGYKYETALLAYLSGMFVLPVLTYLALHVYI